MFDKALSTYNRALGIDNRHGASVHYNRASAKRLSGNLDREVECLRESVRNYGKLGFTDEKSKAAAKLLREFEGSG